MPGPAYLRSSRTSPDAGYTLAPPPSWHCPRLYLPSPLVSACGYPLTPTGSYCPCYGCIKQHRARQKKMTAPHQQSATDRTAGPQSLFLYFFLGLYTPTLRARDLKPCKRCPVLMRSGLGLDPGAHSLPPRPPTSPGGPHALSVTLLQLIRFQ